MFNIVLEKLNVVGVWYTNDKIILTGMDWLLCVFHNFSGHLFLIIREPGYWYQQPLSDYKKCQIAVCSSVAYGTHWDPQRQPDTTGVVITPLQQIHIDNRGQPACGSLMGLRWGCPIDWARKTHTDSQRAGWRNVSQQCQKLGKYLQVHRTTYFWALQSFNVFIGSLFQIKLNALSTVLFSGFQRSTWALNSTE